MRFGILGPVEVIDDHGGVVALGGPKQRSSSPLLRGGAVPFPPLVRLLLDADFGRCEAATAGLVDVPADEMVL